MKSIETKSASPQTFTTPRRAAMRLLMGLFLLPACAGLSEQRWGYDTEVSPLPHAPWINQAVVICMPYETPWDAEGQTLKPWAGKLQAAGFTLAAMYPDSTCRLYDETPEEPWADECRKQVALCHRHGIKAIAGAYPSVGSRGPRYLIQNHPEWRLQGPYVPADPSGIGCMVNPAYAKALRELLARRIKEFDIDAYQFDGLPPRIPWFK